MTSQQTRGVICAGNWIVDLVHDIERWPNENDLTRIQDEAVGVGGGAANVITALAHMRTGLPLIPVGAIGVDELASVIADHCAELGLPVDYLVRKSSSSTAVTHVMSVPGHSRTFFYRGGANDRLEAADFPAELFQASRARIFYLGYLLLLGALDRIEADGATGAARILARARAAGMNTCVDLVSSDQPDAPSVIRAALPQVDYLIANEIEAARATAASTTDKAGLATRDGLLAASTALLRDGVQRAVVLHTPTLTLWHERDAEPVWADPDPVGPGEIVSPVGAGDAFCAGALLGIHEDWGPEGALELANLAARASLAGRTATDAIPPLSTLMPTAAPVVARGQGSHPGG